MTSLLLIAVAGIIPTVFAGSPPACSSSTPLSCSSSSTSASCCYSSPGGQVLQTQFWDYNVPNEPSNSWTIHGLWPDNCDGSYKSSCDSSRAYTNIAQIMTDFGYTDTLSYMEKYWLNDNGDDEELWEHEWATHGTCFNTITPSCYSNYQLHEEAADFFKTTVNLFKTLPTYTWLANAGITPSSSKTYTLSQIQTALANAFGHTVSVYCSGSNLNQVYYTFNVKGSINSGQFVATGPTGQSASSCPKTGIKYNPRTS